MLPRQLLLFAAAASLALSSAACSSLTRPSEITIAPEPVAVAQVAAPAPAAPMPGAAPGKGG